MMKIMIMMKIMMIMKGGGEGTPEGGAGAGRRSSAGPRWAADLDIFFGSVKSKKNSGNLDNFFGVVISWVCGDGRAGGEYDPGKSAGSQGRSGS